MMVSKVAVIALVAIVACPILLGYAMNLQQVTEYGYEESGESVNVTQLLQDGTAYNYAHADIYNLNTRFILKYGNDSMPTYPSYSLTNSRTSFPVNQIKVANWYPTDPTYFSDFSIYHYIAEYDSSVGYLFIDITRDVLPGYGYSRLHELYYDKSTNSVYGSYYSTVNTLAYFHHDQVNHFQITAYGTFTADTRLYYVLANSPASTYVNIAAGYYLNQYTNDYTATTYDRTYLDLPDNPRNLLMTVDLNTVSAANSSFYIVSSHTYNDYVRLVKTTDSGGVHWVLYDGSSPDPRYDLYYDPARTNNTYQIYFDLNGYQLRYVGDWPTMIGAANYFLTYSGDWNPGVPHDYNLGSVFVWGDAPLFRIDDSEYRAMEYPIIENKTYSPAQFKNNPSTKISSIIAYGDSITFGGNTYAVTNGKIHLGSRDIPVDKIVFSSSPAEGSGYENKIGNTLISITAQPSTITFDGQWSASITTTAQSEVSYTKTEWTPGEFGWDGIDQNFLMVGLLTSLGAFIALGIYIRRTKAALWPLLIVCGGAAMLFFVML